MSIEEQFAIIQADEREKGYRLEIARLRQIISCAACAHCSDPIADREWDLDDDERLVHKDCRAETDRQRNDAHG